MCLPHIHHFETRHRKESIVGSFTGEESPLGKKLGPALGADETLSRKFGSIISDNGALKNGY